MGHNHTSDLNTVTCAKALHCLLPSPTCPHNSGTLTVGGGICIQTNWLPSPKATPTNLPIGSGDT